MNQTSNLANARRRISRLLVGAATSRARKPSPHGRAVSPRLWSPQALFRWAFALALFAAAPAYAQSTAPPGAAPAQPLTMVNDFRVTGNTLLPQASLDSALEPFKAGTRSMAQLREAAQAVQDLYARAGYGAVVAFLPEQSSRDGLVTIEVVEGRVKQVSVSGNSQFTQDNIRASLPALTTGVTPELKRIDAQIEIANENPSKKVQVLLQPGQSTGEVVARVTVQELPVRRWSVALDNTGNSRTGDLRASLGWQHANLWGLDHILSTQAQFSPDKLESVRVLSVGYRLPLYAQQTVLDAYAAYSDVDGGSTATLAGNLQFNGQGRLAGIRATRYLSRWGEADQRLSLAFDHRAYINNCAISGLPGGACGTAGEDVAVQPVSIEYTLQRPGENPLGFAISLHHNLQLGGGDASDAAFEAVRAGAKPRYTSLRLSGFAGATVGEGWQVQARAAGQFSGDALVPGEQFGIGGIASLRGYEERELAGDSGITASIELIGPNIALTFGARGGDLRGLVFVDAGLVSNRLSTPCLNSADRCDLASAGIGARFNLGQLQASLYVANARRSAARTERNDNRAHFALSYRF